MRMLMKNNKCYGIILFIMHKTFCLLVNLSSRIGMILIMSIMRKLIERVDENGAFIR